MKGIPTALGTFLSSQVNCVGSASLFREIMLVNQRTP